MTDKEMWEQDIEFMAKLREENEMLWNALNEIKEFLYYGKALIEIDKNDDIDYGFLVNAEQIKEILDKVYVSNSKKED